MIIKCIASCVNDKTHNSCFLPVKISCTPEEYKAGKHKEIAVEWARTLGYNLYNLHEEENGPEHYFSKYDWDTIETINVQSDTYQITVTFTRLLSEDLEIARANFPDASSDDMALILQLRKELQGAYDETGISGRFSIKKIERTLQGEK